jgi:hypothetical protein
VIAITKRAFFTIGLRCPFCGQKSLFQNRLGAAMASKPRLQAGNFFRAIHFRMSAAPFGPMPGLVAAGTLLPKALGSLA